MTQQEYGRGLLRHWLLEPDALFLNHGSFGAAPCVVLEAQQAWRERMERQPVRFMTRELPGALRAAADRLGTLLGARGADLVFVDNATTGVNAVLRSTDWQSGDELLLNRHAYEAVRAAAHFIADRHGVLLREAAVPFPVCDADAIVQAYERALSPRTRLAIVDHVCSPTAVVAPVERIVALCRARGCAVLVDGAHAPGMLEVDIARVGADWYTGNCHKWLFAPKGCAFLWTAPARQPTTHALTLSRGYGSGYHAEFDWTGTRDPSAWLSVTAAIEFHESLGGTGLQARNHELAVRAAHALAEAWQAAVPAPDTLLGAMVTLPLPGTWPADRNGATQLHDRLWHEHRIEVPIIPLDGRLWLRLSAQAYNAPEDYQRLAQAVLSL